MGGRPPWFPVSETCSNYAVPIATWLEAGHPGVVITSLRPLDFSRSLADVTRLGLHR